MRDWLLLRRYVDERSEAAFAALVDRHLRLVYNTCCRETGSRELAEDATQVTLSVLAKKARSIKDGSSLAGWLFATARLASRQVRRQEGRMCERLNDSALNEAPERDFRDAVERGHVVNDALGALSPLDRQIVLLRYFQDLSFAEIGALMSLSADSANKRASRALQRMRTHLSRKGATAASADFSALLTAGAGTPFSQTLRDRIMAQAAGHPVGPPVTASASLSQSTKGVLNQMTATPIKAAIVVTALLVVGIGSARMMAAQPHRLLQALLLSEPTPRPIVGLSQVKAGGTTVTRAGILKDLNRYPTVLNSLSCHARLTYSRRLPGRIIVNGVAVHVDPPPAVEASDWAFSGNLLRFDHVMEYDRDGKPTRESVYVPDDGRLVRIINWQTHGVSIGKSAYIGDDPRFRHRDGNSPLALGYWYEGDWLGDVFRKSGAVIVGAGSDPRFGPLVEVDANLPYGVLGRFWLAVSHGYVCVRQETAVARPGRSDHKVVSAAQLTDGGGISIPTEILSDRTFTYDGGGGGEDYRAKFTDIHVNDVPKSTFLPPLTPAMSIWVADPKTGVQSRYTVNASGKLVASPYLSAPSDPITRFANTVAGWISRATGR